MCYICEAVRTLSHHSTVLTKIVNLPVSSSLFSGSRLGSKRTSPSRCRVASCCSYNATARLTSNFRAARNLTAVAQETGPALRRRRSRLTSSMKFLVACGNKLVNYNSRNLKLTFVTCDNRSARLKNGSH